MKKIQLIQILHNDDYGVEYFGSFRLYSGTIIDEDYDEETNQDIETIYLRVSKWVKNFYNRYHLNTMYLKESVTIYNIISFLGEHNANGRIKKQYLTALKEKRKRAKSIPANKARKNVRRRT